MYFCYVIFQQIIGLQVFQDANQMWNSISVKWNRFMLQLFFWLQKCMVARYFSNNNGSESPPCYLAKLEFKYFEVLLFHVTAFVLLGPEM